MDEQHYVELAWYIVRQLRGAACLIALSMIVGGVREATKYVKDDGPVKGRPDSMSLDEDEMEEDCMEEGGLGTHVYYDEVRLSKFYLMDLDPYWNAALLLKVSVFHWL